MPKGVYKRYKETFVEESICPACGKSKLIKSNLKVLS